MDATARWNRSCLVYAADEGILSVWHAFRWFHILSSESRGKRCFSVSSHGGWDPVATDCRLTASWLLCMPPPACWWYALSFFCFQGCLKGSSTVEISFSGPPELCIIWNCSIWGKSLRALCSSHQERMSWETEVPRWKLLNQVGNWAINCMALARSQWPFSHHQRKAK